MTMPPYAIACQTAGCGGPAKYKVAAEWSDGSTVELKTYALCCERCLPNWYDRARDRQRTCRVTIDETLAKPGIYERTAGRLVRRTELESP
jgi:hypothetical protein